MRVAGTPVRKRSMAALATWSSAPVTLYGGPDREDSDWSRKVRWHGYRLTQVPVAEIVHSRNQKAALAPAPLLRFPLPLWQRHQAHRYYALLADHATLRQEVIWCWRKV